ncbi:MAG: rhodanese-like domain-containing protein [Anaerolineales bacterium]
MAFLKTLFGGGGAALSAADVRAKLDDKSQIMIVDVRTPDEHKSGVINGARLIPLQKLEAQMSKLPQDREIICVCRSGARSGTAARKLKAAGYNAVNMKGGMLAWERAGYPVKRGR